jgi:Ni,Fe-hydrogenase III component G
MPADDAGRRQLVAASAARASVKITIDSVLASWRSVAPTAASAARREREDHDRFGARVGSIYRAHRRLGRPARA